MMKQTDIRRILKDTDYVRFGGSAEELRCAEYLKARCEALGVQARIEPFAQKWAEIKKQKVFADGKEIPCRAFGLCGSVELEAPLYYMPNQDPASLTNCAGKIVMLDGGPGYFIYHDLVKAGAVGFLTYVGSPIVPDRDIDQRELLLEPEDVVLPGARIHATSAIELIRRGVKTVRIEIEQTESEGESRNVIAELPGTTDEWILMTAHYDSVSLSHGAYDNMSGCVALLDALQTLAKGAPHRYGIRFLFCGSEEIGLLGSKAYAKAHEDELGKTALCINVDMIGTYMGKFIACCTSEDKLASFLAYQAAIEGWGIATTQGVYSSDSTPIADHGVPAVSFARLAGGLAPVHVRYDTKDVLSAKQLQLDADYITRFAALMADAVKCPVSREMPENMKNELDEYLCRKRPQPRAF